MVKPILVFDFDGVLVDSYSGLEEVYVEALREHPEISVMSLEEVRRLARELVILEDHYDSIRQYNRFRLVKALLSSRNLIADEVVVRKIVEKYWAKRIEKTIIFSDAEEALRKLRGKHVLILLTDHDGEPGLKIKRVKASGLDKYFDEIIIAGEPGQPATKREGLLHIMDKHRVRPEHIVFIDDKPKVIASVRDLKVTTVLRRFKPQNMYQAWTGEPVADYTISSIKELLTILKRWEKDN